MTKNSLSAMIPVEKVLMLKVWKILLFLLIFFIYFKEKISFRTNGQNGTSGLDHVPLQAEKKNDFPHLYLYVIAVGGKFHRF